ncbi:MAG TPA: gamma-glutamyl-phosphate reductase, partial [Bacillota bacterium]|nr:gamma-glutamyl-phosphate reductase [Bacillota bacterium]
MEIGAYMEQIGRQAKATVATIGRLSSTAKNNLLQQMAELLLTHQAELIAANRIDVEKGIAKGLSKALIDRLTLNPERIAGMAEGLRTLVGLEDPIGNTVKMWQRPNGLEIGQQRVPLGV